MRPTSKGNAREEGQERGNEREVREVGNEMQGKKGRREETKGK